MSCTTYSKEDFNSFGIKVEFTQDYISFSQKDVIRGMHFQKAPYSQDKLIRVVNGSVHDVILDMNPESENYKKYCVVVLDSQKGESLFVPGKYAHGFCVLSSEGALVEYKISGAYRPEAAGGIRFDDPLFNIEWPTQTPILSEQDSNWNPMQNPK
jgi:dTDP-4-dehydrorhamnose 3,5-epimerase